MVQEISAAFLLDKRIEIRKIPRPKIDQGSVIVKMVSSGICGTDLEKLSGDYKASQILGHEVSGLVSESLDENFKVGDKVVPHHHVSCGVCYLCKKGAETMCESFRTSNFDPGGFADEFKVPAHNVGRGGLHKFKDISFDEASLAEPLGCCIRGLERATGAKLDSGQNKTHAISSALIVGAGPIGLMHMELLKSIFSGISLVAVDVSDTRLAFAEKFENASVLKASPSFVDAAKKLSNQEGYDLVVVSTSNPGAFSMSVACMRKSGSLLLFGAAPKGATYPLDLQSALLNEVTLTTSYATTEREIDIALDFLESRKINGNKFITARFPLEETSHAFEVARSEGQIKVVIKGKEEYS
ncbi:MAG: alcohol dehydrogenase catalytic domain-containing protein [Nitrososphaerales archaeon]